MNEDKPQKSDFDWAALKANLPSIRRESMTVTLPQHDPIRPMSSVTDGIYPVIGDPRTYYLPEEHENVFFEPEKIDPSKNHEAFKSSLDRYLRSMHPTIFARLDFWKKEHGPTRSVITRLLAGQYVRELGTEPLEAWHKARALVHSDQNL